MEAPRHPTTLELARHLAALRNAAGLDIETFAAQAELDAAIVLELEAGTRSWTLDDLEAFARALGVPLPTIFRRWDG